MELVALRSIRLIKSSSSAVRIFLLFGVLAVTVEVEGVTGGGVKAVVSLGAGSGGFEVTEV